jgi:glutathione S-transferase
VQDASALLNLIGGFYNAPSAAHLAARAGEIHARLRQLEQVLGDGPYFDGAFGMVDAAFGPVFRYLDVFDQVGDFDFWRGLPKVQRWRKALAERPSVHAAAHPRYQELLRDFLLRRGSALSRQIEARPL